MFAAFALAVGLQAPAATESRPSGGVVHWLNDWIQNRAGGLVEGIALGLVTLVLGLWIAKVIVGAARRLLVRARVDETLARFLSNLAFYALATLVALAALERVGVQTASFIAVLGAAGLAIGFALQGSLANLASGVMIMLFRPFRIGDLILAGGQEGVVEEIQVFATVLRSGDNKKVILPNSAITGGSIVNYTGNPTRRVDLSFAVAGGEDVQRVKSVIEATLASIPEILKDPPPDIEVLEVGAATKLIVRPWCRTDAYWAVYHAVQERLKAAFERERIAGPVPRTEVVSVK